jgi:hypothetical protein
MGAKEPARAPNRRDDGSVDRDYERPRPSPPPPPRCGGESDDRAYARIKKHFENVFDAGVKVVICEPGIRFLTVSAEEAT